MLTFAIAVPGADLLADADKTITASITTTDAAGNRATADDSEGYTVDTAPPLPTITLDADITADDILNAAEPRVARHRQGRWRCQGGRHRHPDGQRPDLHRHVATRGAGVLGFAIAVPGADLSADGDKTIAASITTTDAAGNSGSASDSEGYTVDTAAPSVVVDIVDTSLNSGDKVSTVTFTFSDAPSGFDLTDVTAVGGTLSGLAVSLTDPKVYTALFTATDGFTGIGSVSVADASYTNAAGNSGTGNNDTVAIDTAPPLPTITLDADITADDILNAAEIAGNVTVTGTVGGDAKAGDTVTLTVNGQNFTGLVVNNAGVLGFAIAVPGADLAADADKTIAASITTTDAAGNSGSASDSEGYSVDTAAPLPTITLDANITADDILNAAEATASITVTGKVGGDAKAGDTVTLTVNGQTFTGTVVDTAGVLTFAIAVPGADLLADADKTIAASISTTDAAGNSGDGRRQRRLHRRHRAAAADDHPRCEHHRRRHPQRRRNRWQCHRHRHGRWRRQGRRHRHPDGQRPELHRSPSVEQRRRADFAIAVPGADLSADGDKTIAASITTTDAAGNSGSASDSEGYTVDTAAPSVVVDIVDTSLNSGDKVSTVTFTFSDAPSGFDLTDVTAVGGTLSGLAVSLTDPKVYTALFTANDGFTGIGSVSVADASYTNAAGNSGTGHNDTVVIDTAPPLPTITLDANITADDILNAAEIAGNVTVTGTVGGDAKAGDTVTLTVNGQNFTGTVVDTAGVLTFAIAVPGADLVADGDKTIDASITTTDAAGNSGSATDSEGYSVDTARRASSSTSSMSA